MGVVSAMEPSILAAAIERLMVSPGLARTLGEQGRRYVDEHLQWSSVAKDMEGLYEAVTAGVPHRLGNRDAGVSGRVQER